MTETEAGPIRLLVSIGLIVGMYALGHDHLDGPMSMLFGIIAYFWIDAVRTRWRNGDR